MKTYRCVYKPGISIGDGDDRLEHTFEAENARAARIHLKEELSQMADENDNSYYIESLVEIVQPEVNRDLGLRSMIVEFHSRR